MGLKTLKKFLATDYIVHMQDNDVCLGTGYVNDVIRIDLKNQKAFLPHECLQGDYVTDICKSINQNMSDVIHAFETEDVLEQRIPVFYFSNEEGKIVETVCEEFGYPNVTVDGKLMSSDFFLTKKEAYAYKQKNLSAEIYFLGEYAKKKCEELDQIRRDINTLTNLSVSLTYAEYYDVHSE